MSGALEKTIAILEYLAARPEGAPLASIATDLNQLRSACHRTLQELIGFGYVRALPQRGSYALTSKLASLGLSFLSKSGVVDIAQPVINRLAEKTEELVRLAIVDGERLTLVAKAQGSRSGLRYDPDMGIELNLSCSAAGHAWLMTLTEDQAMQAVARQGMGDRARFGPNAPRSMRALNLLLKEHRKRGFSMVNETYAPGMNSMAAPVQRRGEPATGVIVVAGPSVRLTPARMAQFGPDLMDAAAELSAAASASPLMQAAHIGTWGNRTDGSAPAVTRRVVRR
ncbi:MAG: IclR family transcriptional regulator [Aquincola tertiaricarbonis]|uniref:IclR family transcriptional regulator n=1 Tax=Aquincola TaxID=391952 RepID=UPI000615349D|nr:MULTISPECIES: IclR family transcriptional regulator [Aquincola]MCR5864161.1 IclR family transcriptional regulator [Aquincola sp. J276]